MPMSNMISIEISLFLKNKYFIFGILFAAQYIFVYYFIYTYNKLTYNEYMHKVSLETEIALI